MIWSRGTQLFISETLLEEECKRESHISRLLMFLLEISQSAFAFTRSGLRTRTIVLASPRFYERILMAKSARRTLESSLS